MAELIIGNPWQKDKGTYSHPASYTRFLLPFSYTLHQIKNTAAINADQLCFQQKNAKDFARERLFYFTAETANVLFQRAIWAEIDAGLWHKKGMAGPFIFQAKSERSLAVSLSPPQLVLFEGQAERPSQHPPLCNGFLIMEAFFPDSSPASERPCLDDLLEFNELFRYIDCPFPEHSKTFSKALKDFPANYQSGQKIGTITDHDDHFSIYKNRWLSLLDNVPLRMHDGQYILPVLPQNISCERKQLRENHLACDNKNCLPYVDNRAFVWTAALLANGAAALAEHNKEVSRPWEFGHWCRLLNVDQPGDSPEKSHQVRRFEQLWAKERTYQRWAEWGTWYGYSYHSGAMLAPITENNNPPLWQHFGEMYFDQVLLLLYLRVTLFSFSRKLTRINQGDDFDQLRNTFKELRASFAKFTNLYQFPLISNQQQGLEMYNAARKSMDIDNLFKEVQEEISSTHEFLEMKANRMLVKKANMIAFIAAVAAIGSLLPEDPRKAVFTFVRGVVTGDSTRGWLFFVVLLVFFKKPIFRLWKLLRQTI